MLQIRAPLPCQPLGKLQKHTTLWFVHLWNKQNNCVCFIHPLHHWELMNGSVGLQNYLKLVEILFQLLLIMWLHCLPGPFFSCFSFLFSKHANSCNHVQNIECAWPRVKRWIDASSPLSPWCYDAICPWLKL